MNVSLGKDEKVISEYQFSPNLVLYWLKAKYTLTNKRVVGSYPNTLLYLIPLGNSQVDQPLKNVASVVASTKFSLLKFIVGWIMLGFAIGLFASASEAGIGYAIGGLLFLLGSVESFVECLVTYFVVINNAGMRSGWRILMWEKPKVQKLVSEINTATAEL